MQPPQQQRQFQRGQQCGSGAHVQKLLVTAGDSDGQGDKAGEVGIDGQQSQVEHHRHVHHEEEERAVNDGGEQHGEDEKENQVRVSLD